jgi:uncharacterized protein with NAD-binding domain and iron-sulfur cluster
MPDPAEHRDPAEDPPATPEKIAVLGGGAAALSAVFAMTEIPDWRSRYEITVYQMGWRLGGKGASSRDPERRGRNEEHGLHVFGGFYHNTFSLLRDCYGEWALLDPGRSIAFDDAFIKVAECTLIGKRLGDGSFETMDLPFPTNDLEPGINAPDPGPFVMLDRMIRYVRETLMRLAEIDFYSIDDVMGIGHGIFSQRAAAMANRLDRLLRRLYRVPLASVLSRPAEKLVQYALAAARDLLLFAEPHVKPRPGQINPAMAGAIVAIFAHGFVRDRLHIRGYGVLDDIETAVWLRRNGANDRVIDSAFIRAGYDYVFAFAGGITDPPARALAASVGVKWFLRFMLTYHGALFYHLNGGMGEIVFTPLYTVLRERGVKFEFFHKVEKIALSADGTQIDAISGIVQARTKAGASYQPLIDWRGRLAWPTRPLYDQLADADTVAANGDLECDWAPIAGAEPFRLDLGEQFDRVILGISVGALHTICADLYQRLPQWQAMLNSASTIPAAGIQIWSTQSTEELGWPRARPDLLTAHSQPFATWADMSFLLEQEDGDAAIRHLSYFCGPIDRRDPGSIVPGGDFARAEHERVTRIATDWLAPNIGAMLPKAVADGVLVNGFLHELFVRANVSASDQYVLSLPGSIGHRLHPGKSGVSNLFLAGDWTRNGLDAGAFEAAVMSGLICARAISGASRPVYGEFD